ncbi:MAG: hypothetical protein A2X25_11825 [Chloroflexi bacterium GWB2_49_20]|nr:MAG: hypothetical protein A2X25_11825 [Chloroflexi bacterium GWB2_49_20]OGN77693.1 MAG: hypothetical protein A2X26_10095 [Chloroflexi bacterium GWC2_49_37]OGN86468.1 MAG: hypothetical protein A2X27_06250 [Chloroflexi bacterium GWD2_49_16]HBG74714.1 hypothetical protein [Anaerolineae bacterium]
MNTPSKNPTFPSLRILPVDRLVPHEKCDELRTLSLIERLKAEKILRNPPIVAPMQDAQGNYVVLDGANRTRAFQTMDIPHILVQVVWPGEPGLNLKTWNQVALGATHDELLAQFGDIPGLMVKLDGGKRLLSDSVDGRSVIQIHLPTGEVYTVFAPTSDLQCRVEILNIIMDRIGKCARMDRTHLDSIDSLTNMYSDLAGLLVFPRFKNEEIIQLASARQMIPAGITRFIISPRALRVNYRLSELSSEKSLVEKDEALKSWLHVRVTRKGVRSYDETTVLFDE